MPLRILPTPRKVYSRKGSFLLSPDTPLMLSPLAAPEEYVAVATLLDELHSRLGMDLPVEKSWSSCSCCGAIRFAIFGRDRKAVPGLAGLPRPQQLGEEGYVLDVSTSGILAAANSQKGLFYAAQTLRQMVRTRGKNAAIEACRIVDWPDFRYRGVMLDVSRFRVPTLERLFELSELLASLKINVLQLYIEHPFAWRRHPDIGRGVSPLTAEDILMLGHRCRSLNIELQANLQSFGHQKHLLTRPGYSRYAELPTGMKPDISEEERQQGQCLDDYHIYNWSLSPAVPETYELIGDLYDEFLPLFDPELFNANCDETWDLGLGRSRDLCRRRGKARVYLEHIKKIHRLARHRGKRMMIWGDIVLDHPELIPELPRDIMVLDWEYKAQGSRNRTCRQFAAAGLEFWVCPGVNSWLTIFPQTEVARVNIREFAKAGKRHGATGLLNTDWGDFGHFQQPSGSFHGYAYGAEQSWRAADIDERDFDRRFSWAVFRDASGRFGRLYDVMGRTNAPFGEDRPLHYRPYLFNLLWENFDSHLFDTAGLTESRLKACETRAWKALGLIEELNRDFPEQEPVLEETAFAARTTLLACARARVRTEIIPTLRSGARPDARNRAALRSLREEWSKCCQRWQQLWMEGSRKSQIDYRLKEFSAVDREYARLLKK